MINQTIPLREEINGYVPTLTTYILDDIGRGVTTRPAVVVCPGGGYNYCAAIEGEPIATRFIAAGFHAFVVRYSTMGNNPDAKYPMALEELSKALEIIREHAEEWNIDKDKIAVCGFSAGAHLACSLGCFWNREPIKTENLQNKPNAMILSYPVISSGERRTEVPLKAFAEMTKSLLKKCLWKNR